MNALHSLLQSVIAVLVFVGFIDLVFQFTRYHFVLQIIVVIGLLCLTFLGLLATHNQFRAGWLIMAFVYAIISFDLLWTYFLRQSLNDQLLMLFAGSAIGIVYSVASMPAVAPTQQASKLETYSEEKSKKKVKKKR